MAVQQDNLFSKETPLHNVKPCLILSIFTSIFNCFEPPNFDFSACYTSTSVFTVSSLQTLNLLPIIFQYHFSLLMMTPFCPHDDTWEETIKIITEILFTILSSIFMSSWCHQCVVHDFEVNC